MPSMTDILENRVINHFFRGSSQSSPATVYLALFTAAPGEDGTGGTEVSGGSYARQAITFGAPSAGATDNTATVTFPTASANWGTITHAVIFDASTSGNAFVVQALSASQTINTGGTFSINTGDIDLSFD